MTPSYELPLSYARMQAIHRAARRDQALAISGALRSVIGLVAWLVSAKAASRPGVKMGAGLGAHPAGQTG